ncbi:anion transporter [Ferrimonas balearica DSM 9799]|uniref:Anion transporter n=1 Tax=Ferrimonas balearica (strain DSM 9799 / CCM 4581 / KCTC 23876 / PAT) TaxID=550540 RepID=E1SVI3_FERBD|nr:DASS family sodium-coupled anion symporter [Ferrimonas balearica]ADN75329.1 anion transporter [Ferrimonas balearica DSM 9799]MBW3138247.1 DASS family sodium-coupled anion symporter [Ferrimonas balearica]MBW3164197.1 DASS family sodium-coupled anion symporter [Ferrimonas balearica]MBY5978997.1 DASS family sodium-coupled anion symporter [Ferrimonas balearica]MBY6105308.1 DASS family sodium-coupled anion symporter [Ferrimonas balearica]
MQKPSTPTLGAGSGLGVTKRDTKAILLIADILLFIAMIQLLPFEPAVNQGLALLVFIAILWLTQAIHITITAILVPVMAVMMGLTDTTKALSNFANPIIFLFFGGFALAAALHVQGIDKRLAAKVVNLSGGKLANASLLLFGVTGLLSMWISNTATAAMMLPLALGMLSQLDPKEHRRTYVYVLLGCAYSANIGGIGTLVGSPPNAIAAAQVGLDFAGWMEFGLVAMAILWPLVIGAMHIMIKPDLSHRFEFRAEQGTMTNSAKLTLAVFLVTVACWIFSKPLSAALGGIAKFDTVVALSAVVALGVLRLVKWSQVERQTDWGVLLLFGGGLTLSGVLKTTGTSVFLANQIYAIFGSTHMALLTLVIILFVVLLTEFASNTASAALLVPVFASIAEVLGVSPVILAVLIGISASCAFMLPVATPPNAIMYGSGHIKQSDMMRTGAVVNLICVVVLFGLSQLLW